MQLLVENGLVLAASSIVTSEALAEASRVIADATTAAVTTLFVAITKHYVWPIRAFDERAIRATVTLVTPTTRGLHGVPRGRIGGACLRCQLFQCITYSSTIAVIRTNCPFACNTIVIQKTITLPSAAVTSARI